MAHSPLLAVVAVVVVEAQETTAAPVAAVAAHLETQAVVLVLLDKAILEEAVIVAAGQMVLPGAAVGLPARGLMATHPLGLVALVETELRLPSQALRPIIALAAMVLVKAE